MEILPPVEPWLERLLDQGLPNSPNEGTLKKRPKTKAKHQERSMEDTADDVCVPPKRVELSQEERAAIEQMELETKLRLDLMLKKKALIMDKWLERSKTILPVKSAALEEAKPEKKRDEKTEQKLELDPLPPSQVTDVKPSAPQASKPERRSLLEASKRSPPRSLVRTLTPSGSAHDAEKPIGSLTLSSRYYPNQALISLCQNAPIAFWLHCRWLA